MLGEMDLSLLNVSFCKYTGKAPETVSLGSISVFINIRKIVQCLPCMLAVLHVCMRFVLNALHVQKLLVYVCFSHPCL